LLSIRGRRGARARIKLLDQAGHALFVDQAQRFNALLEELIAATVLSAP
jgi:pimeloyl-ACP methyl ester carboxylesterase